LPYFPLHSRRRYYGCWSRRSGFGVAGICFSLPRISGSYMTHHMVNHFILIVAYMMLDRVMFRVSMMMFMNVLTVFRFASFDMGDLFRRDFSTLTPRNIVE